MTPEQLHDAITLLPEDLLTPVDQLRQKKHFPWRSLATTAACLCLVVGLSFLFPSADNMMNSGNSGWGNPEQAEPMEDGEHSYSQSEEGALVEVLSVEENSLRVFSKPSVDMGEGDFCIQLTTLTLSFENLEEIPDVLPGQTLLIYYEPEQFDEETMTVKPYKMELIEEETK